ncbi:MAG: MFS transporter, partial [Myxococcota bacterium]
MATTYFAEGFPYTIVNSLAPVLFKALGASYAEIGLAALLHIPWNLKFLWAPALDIYESRRRWLVATELLIGAALVGVALLSAKGLLFALSLALFGVALLSATQDIAVDAFYLEALDEVGQSRFVGFRAMAYRLASILLSGVGLVAVDAVGWPLALGAMAAVMFALAAFHAKRLPSGLAPRRPVRQLGAALVRPHRVAIVAAVLVAVLIGSRSGLGEWLKSVPVLGRMSWGGWISTLLLAAVAGMLLFRRALIPRLASSDYGRGFAAFLEGPSATLILLFLLSFRAGEGLLIQMKWPFLEDQMH